MKNWSKEKREFWERVYCAAIMSPYEMQRKIAAGSNGTFQPAAIADAAMADWEKRFEQEQ